MKLTSITQLVALGAGALIALGTVAACGKSTEPTSNAPTRGQTSSSVAAMPQTGTFIAKLPANEGQPQTVLAVTVEGDRVAAYACNNSDDEAWFFGTQKNGSMDLTSMYQDKLQATFDGTDLSATLTMNDVAYTGTAQPAAPPAGIYTATAGDAGAVWIVMADKSVVGVTRPELQERPRTDRQDQRRAASVQGQGPAGQAAAPTRTIRHAEHEQLHVHAERHDGDGPPGAGQHDLAAQLGLTPPRNCIPRGPYSKNRLFRKWSASNRGHAVDPVVSLS